MKLPDKGEDFYQVILNKRARRGINPFDYRDIRHEINNFDSSADFSQLNTLLAERNVVNDTLGLKERIPQRSRISKDNSRSPDFTKNTSKKRLSTQKSPNGEEADGENLSENDPNEITPEEATVRQPTEPRVATENEPPEEPEEESEEQPQP